MAWSSSNVSTARSSHLPLTTYTLPLTTNHLPLYYYHLPPNTNHLPVLPPPPPPAGALKRTLAASTTDADHVAVAINRHGATNARERDDPIEAARHSVT